MRLVLVCTVIAALIAPSSAAEQRWTLAYAQGTTEAIIRNERGADVNIYCPAGQSEPVPGIFIKAKGLNPKKDEQVAVQFVVDGKNHAFDFDEIQFQANGRAAANALAALIDALTKSKSKNFVVEFPKLGISERFSLLGARKAMTSAKEFLDGCVE